MRREVELEQRLHSLEALGEAVGAMKSLSAHHYRQVRQAVKPARTYREGVERMVRSVGAGLGEGPGGAGLLVIGAELGLCGGYNARVVELGARRRSELGEGPTFCVGRRATTLLGRFDVDVARSYPGATGIRGLTGLLLQLAEDVLTEYASRGLSSFEIAWSPVAGVGRTAPRTDRLLPIEAGTPDQSLRPRYVRREQLVTAVVREFLYIALFDFLLDSLASEHGARLTATAAAERWLDDRVTRLRRRLMASRRESSTQEVIEITSAVRARNRAS